MMSPWRIELFGQLRAHRAEHSLTRFRSHKTAALLAYLAYYHHRQHSRETLIDLFWPEGDLEAGRHNLSMSLSSLRRQLEPPGTPVGAVIVANRQNVGLNPAAVVTDVGAFETGLNAADKATGRTEKAQLLARALDLYKDRLLPGFYEDWLVPEQTRLDHLYFEAVRQLIALLEESEEPRHALEVARRALVIDPLREETHAGIMRLLSSVQEPVAALTQYRELQRLLEKEIGDAPSASVQALAHRIRKEADSRDAELSSVVPEAVRAFSLLRKPELGSPHVAEAAQRTQRPAGTVTFLLIDVEGSSTPAEPEGETFRTRLERDIRLLRQRIQEQCGYEVKETGDGFVAAFAAVREALGCALKCRRALFSAGSGLPVRMALHTGDVEIGAGDYQGPVLQRASRLLTAAHAGQTLCSEETATVLRRSLPDDVSLLDLGLYRLRDMRDAEHVFQIQDADLPIGEFPLLRADRAHAGRLPLSFSRFFGREAEMTTVMTLLVSDQRRLVTLTGPGGTGKTRLALETARRLEEPFPGAIWFVPLADMSDPTLIAEAILEALGLPSPGSVDPLDQAVRALSGQNSCLVLDNFEQLADSGAHVVQTLLERVSTLSVLVTSRQTLGLTGECEFAVPTLPTPPRIHTPSTLVQYGSVQLFIDRAQAIRPDFQVTDSNAPAVAELCVRLEGLPLAIELAAARVQVLTPAQMLARLDRRFELLRTRRKGVTARHQALEVCIDWSFRLLEPEVQAFFCRLCLLRGEWTLETAEIVAGESDVLEKVQRLREASFLLMREAFDAGGTTLRFHMLESLREFGLERLDPRELNAGYERLTRHFSALSGPDPFATVDTENVRVVVCWCHSSEIGHSMELDLLNALMHFWSNRGGWLEGREWMEAALERHAGEATLAQRKAWNTLGFLNAMLGDDSRARECFERVLADSKQAEDPVMTVRALSNLAIITVREGDSSLGCALMEQSLHQAERLGDARIIATQNYNVGAAHLDLGHYEEARRFLDRGLQQSREQGFAGGIALCLGSLAQLARKEGDSPSARRMLEESLEMYRDVGEQPRVVEMLDHLVELLEEQGDSVQAHIYAEESALLQKRLRGE